MDQIGRDLPPDMLPNLQNIHEDNDWYPFASCIEFKMVEFLFTLIDTIPLGDVPWNSVQVEFSGESSEHERLHWMRKSYDVWFHNPNAVVETLLNNPDFDNHFDYAPYCEFEPSGECQWENMMSGNWAWNHADTLSQDPSMQGAMLVPIILGSDKMTVSIATGQNDYYPLYLLIGNVHNNVHCAHRNSLMLLTFLVIPKSMSKPEVWHCPDGHFRLVIYALAAYIADYPEQIVLSCLVQGWCPLCMAISGNLDRCNSILQSQTHAEYCIHAFVLAELWDQYGIVGDLTLFTNDFPHADIYKMLTPDLLHQIIKGVFKDHLVSWIGKYLKTTYSEVDGNCILDDIDWRIVAVLLYPHLRCFPEGRWFKQWTSDDSKALMKVYLAAVEGHVPHAMVHTLHLFLDFCYYAWQNSLNKSALDNLQCALDSFHHNHCIFQETGVCAHSLNSFSLPCQHTMNHYHHLIQEFGVLNGLYFESCGMLEVSVISASQGFPRDDPANHNKVACHGVDDTANSGDNDNNDSDDNEDNGPHVLNYIQLVKTPAHKYPSRLLVLACHIGQADFLPLLHHFLNLQLHNNTNPDATTSYPDFSNSPVSVFHSAIATFYAPSDLSGLRGMLSEHIQNTIFLEKDQDKPGMKGLHVARVFLFFSFTYDSIKYPCALIHWFTMVSDEPAEDTGMWIVEPEVDVDVYGSDHLPTDIQHMDCLDIFHAYYVNKYIDHHAFKIVF
ncbi:hypothetical protein EDC04DRAFT_2867018 [Pisolithus marmoratus]|nr:hypothetical protein EDC04DRAFT_2867018 [Pisolithus marmoratus]